MNIEELLLSHVGTLNLEGRLLNYVSILLVVCFCLFCIFYQRFEPIIAGLGFLMIIFVTFNRPNLDLGISILLITIAIIVFVVSIYRSDKYLFSLGLDFVGELDNQQDNAQVPDRLKQEFQNHNRSLTAQAHVQVDQSGSSWTIIDANKVKRAAIGIEFAPLLRV